MIFFSKISIRIKLFVALLLVSVIAIGIELSGVIGISRGNLTQTLEQQQKVTADYVAKTIERYFVDLNRRISFIENIERTGIGNAPVIQGIMAGEVEKNNDFIANIAIDDRDRIISSMIVENFENLRTLNLLNDSLYQRAKETGAAQVGRIEWSDTAPLLRIAYPLIRNRGFIYLVVSLKNFQDEIVNIAKSGNLSVALIDSNGTVLLDSSGSKPSAAYTAFRIKSDEMNLTTLDPKGTRIRAIIKKSILDDTYILVSQETRVINKPIISMLSLSAFWLLLTCGIVFILSILFSQSFLQPIFEIVRGMKAASKGNLDYRIPPQGKDEIGYLADSFNGMLGNLKNLNEELTRKEQLAAIGQLTATIGHEIRNPLQSIKMSAMLLSGYKGKEPTPADVKKFADIIKHELFIVNKISENLLGYSRERAPANEEININAIIAEVTGLLKIPANVTVTADAPNEVVMYGEAVEIRQIIINLMDNAIDILKMRGGEVIVGVREEEGKIKIWIGDNGPGISEENQKKLFKPLFSTKAKGTGLGLAVVKRIVERHKGKIEVESKVGVGTKFIITFDKKRDKPQ